MRLTTAHGHRISVRMQLQMQSIASEESFDLWFDGCDTLLLRMTLWT